MESVKVRSVLIKGCSGQMPAVAGLVPARAAINLARAVAAISTKDVAAGRETEVRLAPIENLGTFALELICP